MASRVSVQGLRRVLYPHPYTSPGVHGVFHSPYPNPQGLGCPSNLPAVQVVSCPFYVCPSFVFCLLTYRPTYRPNYLPTYPLFVPPSSLQSFLPSGCPFVFLCFLLIYLPTHLRLPSTYQPIYLPTHPVTINLPTYLPTYPLTRLPSIYQPIHLPIHLPTSSPTYSLSTHPPS